MTNCLIIALQYGFSYCTEVPPVGSSHKFGARPGTRAQRAPE